jgi:hypothetical protein
VELTQDQVQAFVSHFIDGLEIRVGTPRMAVRYGNALMFSLPILKGEVHPVDLMLVEGLRVFYPKLYDVVRSSPDVFLGSQLDTPGDKEQAKKRTLEVINKGLEGLTVDEIDAAKDLLKVLFPRLSGVFRSIQYGAGWEETWAKEQRVASKQYFGRFFSYSIPEGDVSDQELDSFIGRSESEPVDTIVTELHKIINDRNADVFVLKLRTKEKKLPPKVSRNLALAIAKIGDSLPNPETLFSFTTAFSQAAILVSHLISNIPKGKDRFDAIRLIVEEGQPLSFAVECFNWIRTKEKTEEEDRIIPIEEENELGRIIADRIKEMSGKQPIYIECPKDTPFLLYVWTRWGSKEEVNQYLASTIDDNPHNALELLKCYLPTSWGSESGPHKGDFRRDQYDAVTKVVETDVLFNALRKIYGSDLDSPQFNGNNTRSLDEQVAHQFAHIYHHVKTEKQEVAVPEEKVAGKP